VKRTINVRVNGEDRSVEIDTRMITAEMLRERLRLTGVHIGCATGNCGACTIYLDGKTVKSCCVLAADVDGSEITTVEALSPGPEDLHPIQEAFVENQGLQCGFCTPGMILAAKSLLDRNPDASETEIVSYMEGNLCRCTGYRPIVRAIQQAQRLMASGGGDA
jgi:aerobic carbon-monoxide dehydrogenase small subunit